jgi:GT2 family glycosyltransferase
VIVPARNNAATTAMCIRSALRALDALKLSGEFVLIDDASDPAEAILPLFQQFRADTPHHAFSIARAKTRLHYTGVFTLGLQLARRENVFFLSNDMIITPSFFLAVLGVAALAGDFGIVRGTSNFADSHPEHTVKPPQELRELAAVEAFSSASFAANGLRFVEDRVLSGDAVLIKRSVIDRIGGLDLDFFGYFGDVDYGLRAHLAGFKLVCAKGAWLLHEGAGHVKAEAKATRKDPALLHQERMQLVETAYQVFRRKWDSTLPPTYAALGSLDLFAMAERNAGTVPLKYDAPASLRGKYDLA